jgi:hypothetical protein
LGSSEFEHKTKFSIMIIDLGYTKLDVIFWKRILNADNILLKQKSYLLHLFLEKEGIEFSGSL